MDWPAQSPDLNPIENLWTILKQKVHNSKPSSLDVLWETLNGFWDNIEESTIESLVASMPKRVKAVIAAKGGATRYNLPVSFYENFGAVYGLLVPYIVYLAYLLIISSIKINFDIEFMCFCL